MNWGKSFKNFFWKKDHNAEKLKRDPIGFFNIHSVGKLQKNEGGLWGIFFEKKSRTMPKKLKDPSVCLARYCVLRGKKGKNFLVQFPGPTEIISNFVELLVELFWSLQVYQKNTDEKP